MYFVDYMKPRDRFSLFVCLCVLVYCDGRTSFMPPPARLRLACLWCMCIFVLVVLVFFVFVC